MMAVYWKRSGRSRPQSCVYIGSASLQTILDRGYGRKTVYLEPNLLTRLTLERLDVNWRAR